MIPTDAAIHGSKESISVEFLNATLGKIWVCSSMPLPQNFSTSDYRLIGAFTAKSPAISPPRMHRAVSSIGKICVTMICTGNSVDTMARTANSVATLPAVKAPCQRIRGRNDKFIGIGRQQQRGFSAVRIFEVRAARPRHFNLDERTVRRNVGDRIFADLEMIGFEQCRARACSRHSSSPAEASAPNRTENVVLYRMLDRFFDFLIDVSV